MPDRIPRCAPVGRTASSIYFLRSLLCTTVFCSYGLGRFGRVASGLAFAAGVSHFSSSSSGWLMRNLRFGPVEWLWRRERSVAQERSFPYLDTMGFLSILEYLPAILGYLSAVILIGVASFVVTARVRRSLFGERPSSENVRGFRAFLSNFE